MFLEAYPKSKNELLYSKIIEIDPEDPPTDKIPFYTFFGVGPKRFLYVFDLLNKINGEQGKPFPLLQFRSPECYKSLEDALTKNLESFQEENLFAEFFQKKMSN